MNGYALAQCLKKVKAEKEAAAAAGGEAAGSSDLRYEQPGQLVTLPSGGLAAYLPTIK